MTRRPNRPPPPRVTDTYCIYTLDQWEQTLKGDEWPDAIAGPFDTREEAKQWVADNGELHTGTVMDTPGIIRYVLLRRGNLDVMSRGLDVLSR